MPSLGRTLQDHDLGHLRIVAELWGLDVPPGRSAEVAPELARRMLEPGLALEVAQSLPAPAREALTFLMDVGGRETMGEVSLRFGAMKPIGPGKRDREQTWRDPQVALEGLWYRGLIGIGFFETPAGPEEFVYIPDELQVALQPLAAARTAPPSPGPTPTIILPAGGAADDAVALLAALRRRPIRSSAEIASPAQLPPALLPALKRHLIHPESLPLLMALLRGLGILQAPPLRPDPDAVRELLAAGRVEVESRLFEHWKVTRRFNDLAHTAGLSAPKGAWPNDPAVSRTAVLDRLAPWNTREWFEIEATIAEIRRAHPTFLRPGGDLDSWLLQDASTGRFLQGLADWELIEGALLRQLILGPLHWLGAVDLGAEDASLRPTKFRLRLDGTPFGGGTESPTPEAAVRVFPDGRVVIPRTTSLAHRYQVARFAEWGERQPEGFRYRITPRALASASAQGLDRARVAAVLEAASGRPVPEPLRRAIDRWSRKGMEAVLEETVVLRVKDPETLRRLRASPATGRYLEEILGPTTARVRRRDREALLTAAARDGLLIQPQNE